MNHPDPDLEQLLLDAKRHIEALRAAMRVRWNRDLPVNELVSDRWDRARALGFGDGASIYDSSYVYGEVSVGEHTWIGPNTILDGRAGLRIGRFCSISAGVQIYTHDTVKWALSEGQAPHELGAVVIGDCCHIGSHSVVLKGVSVGDHSVVAACSLVTRPVAAYTVVAGTPARPIGRVVVGHGGTVELVIHA
jgi:acetyltransferase-like isoleucine patch superfamily enzyme